MFISPHQCNNFQEWLDQEIAAAERDTRAARDAVWDATEDQETPLLQRTLTVYRLEAVVKSLKEVREALTAFDSGRIP